MISADGVTVSFKRRFRKRLKALDGFSVSVNEGDVFALIGPNGAGKSTAMGCFLGLIRPDAGSLSLLGQKPEPGSEIFRDIAYLPEEPNYHLYLTVEEAVSYYASLCGKRISRKEVHASIERVGLGEFMDLKLSKCSKGMKQKAGIAQCLVTKPRLLFLDEPTRGLDPPTVRLFRDILIEMNREGCTAVINSHVLSEIEAVCNKAAIINKGRLIMQDHISNLRKQDMDIYVLDVATGEPLPEYFKTKGHTRDSVQGEIPASKFREFVEFTTTSGARINGCSLKRLSLEDAFLSILENKAHE